jgi:hypothetical protein
MSKIGIWKLIDEKPQYWKYYDDEISYKVSIGSPIKDDDDLNEDGKGYPGMVTMITTSTLEPLAMITTPDIMTQFKDSQKADDIGKENQMVNEMEIGFTAVVQAEKEIRTGSAVTVDPRIKGSEIIKDVNENSQKADHVTIMITTSVYLEIHGKTSD